MLDVESAVVVFYFRQAAASLAGGRVNEIAIDDEGMLLPHIQAAQEEAARSLAGIAHDAVRGSPDETHGNEFLGGHLIHPQDDPNAEAPGLLPRDVEDELTRLRPGNLTQRRVGVDQR